MIKTKLVQLSYKVKNKIKNNDKSILQKGRSLQQALQIVQKGKNKNAQHRATTTTSQSMAIE